MGVGAAFVENQPELHIFCPNFECRVPLLTVPVVSDRRIGSLWQATAQFVLIWRRILRLDTTRFGLGASLECRGLAALVLGLVLCAASVASADVISLNFDSGQDGGVPGGPAATFPLAPTDLAGFVHVGNWNNLATNVGASATLVNQAGAVVPGASVTYTSNGTYATNTNPATSGDYDMMHAGLDEAGISLPHPPMDRRIPAR